jgi:SAM-dependent methyltransferase
MPPVLQQATGYADTFAFQWAAFRTTQLDSRTGLKLSFRRFWENTKWVPRNLHGARVLEAGSGAGRFTEVMLEAGAIVVTFDVTDAVFVNRENNADKGNVAFFRGDICHIPIAESQFDYAFCYGVLQHVPDHQKALAELVRVLKPGGGLAIDWYIKTDRLNPFYQPKYFWRRWTVGMAPDRLLRVIRAYIPYWLPIDTLIRQVPWIGPKLLAVLRVPCWNYIDVGLCKSQRLEWAVLDTFDALAPAVDEPKTTEEVCGMLSALPLTDIEVAVGGNGVLGNARRA